MALHICSMVPSNSQHTDKFLLKITLKGFIKFIIYTDLMQFSALKLYCKYVIKPKHHSRKNNLPHRSVIKTSNSDEPSPSISPMYDVHIFAWTSCSKSGKGFCNSPVWVSVCGKSKERIWPPADMATISSLKNNRRWCIYMCVSNDSALEGIDNFSCWNLFKWSLIIKISMNTDFSISAGTVEMERTFPNETNKF